MVSMSIHKVINLTVKLQDVKRVDYSHYYVNADGYLYSDGIVYLKTNYEPTNTLAPGKEGILEISLYPSYSSIDRIEVESITNSGFSVAMQPYEYSSSKGGYYISSKPYTTNGNIISFTSANLTGGYIYLKTLVSSNVSSETVFTITVRIYRNASDSDPIIENITLVARYIPEATIYVNGKTKAVVGRGTTNEVSIVVYDDETYSYQIEDVEYYLNYLQNYYGVGITQSEKPTLVENLGSTTR
jgi:hypothetical protein